VSEVFEDDDFQADVGLSTELGNDTDDLPGREDDYDENHEEDHVDEDLTLSKPDTGKRIKEFAFEEIDHKGRIDLNIEIKSVSEFIEKFCTNLPDDEMDITNNARRLIVYRGEASAEYELSPSVLREVYGGGDNEALFYHEMERLSPVDFATCSLFDKLCRMQHYALPTRLLDFTANPLVALYFACEGNEKEASKPGKVIAAQGNFYYSGHPEIQYLSAIPEFVTNTGSTIDAFTEYLRSQHFIIDRTDSVNEVLRYECVGVIPNFTSERLRAQHGLFLLFGLGKNENTDSNSLVQVVKKIASYRLLICIIPQESKQDILRQLKILGIHKATLFPDLENIAEYVKMNTKKKKIAM